MGPAPHRLGTVLGAGLLALAATAARGVRIEVGSAAASPGQSTAVAVRLRTEGAVVVATENDLVFAEDAPVTSCRPNPGIGKELTSFGFLPPGCTPGDNCDRVRAIVLGNDLDPIPDGSLLYTCTVELPATLIPDIVVPLGCEDAGASDPQAEPIEAACEAGAVHVLRAPLCVGDGNGDRRVSIAELVEAVGNALDGCPEAELP